VLTSAITFSPLFFCRGERLTRRSNILIVFRILVYHKSEINQEFACQILAKNSNFHKIRHFDDKMGQKKAPFVKSSEMKEKN